MNPVTVLAALAPAVLAGLLAGPGQTGAAAPPPAPAPVGPVGVASLPASRPPGWGSPAPGGALPAAQRARTPYGWPLAPAPTVVRRFVPPASDWAPGHRGVDLAAAEGQPVLAAGDGVVTFAGVIAGRGVVTVRHAGGWRTTYEPVTKALPVGTTVRRGDRIGVVATTPGHCAPRTCLHWGALDGAAYRDPLALLGGTQVVLLPVP